ncbi:response regulator [Pseudomonas sp. B28(2017)]|uniref:response regulator n=1 Tax=Pseudomonas sp. B28(2017) TaxID=1981730 RepID=UPI000A1EA7CD|nr:response regulator [Pseudomonas sp. B28(2017)]
MNVNWEGLLPILGTVLIVDDDPILRTLMGYILADMGAEPVAYPTAEDALTYLLQSHAHCLLVIVNHRLPGEIQGIDLIKIVRGKWPSMRSILTSCDLLKSLTIPRQSVYLGKPWSPDQLVATVAAVLRLTPPALHQAF